jgi:hypothetical protein
MVGVLSTDRADVESADCFSSTSQLVYTMIDMPRGVSSIYPLLFYVGWFLHYCISNCIEHLNGIDADWL